MITSIATPRRIRIAGLAAGAVAVAGAAVYMTASAAGYNFSFTGSSSPSGQTNPATAAPLDRSGTASAVCTDFLGHFASDLGTGQSKVDSAFQQAIGQTLADEVKNGTLTQAQADKIKAGLAGKQPCQLAAGLGAPKPAGAAYTKQLLAAAASALGVTTQQLQADLAKGMTLSQVAAAETPPVTEAQFRTRLIAALKPLLDQAVATGQLTSDQEQKVLQRLQTGPIPYWDKPLKRPAPAASPSPGA